MALAQHKVVRRDHQPALDARLCLGPIQVVHLAQPFDIGKFKVVHAVLDLGVPVQLGKGVHAVHVDVPHLRLVLEVHDDAVEAIGNLDAHRVERQTAGLLKVGELRDFLPIQPHLPT